MQSERKGISLQLHPTGFSVQSGAMHPYDVDSRNLLRGIDCGRTTQELLELGDVVMQDAMVDGRIQLNVTDYRTLDVPPATAQLTLRHDPAAVMMDLEAEDLSESEKLAVEQRLLLVMGPRLCLEPTPAVLRIGNLKQYNRLKANCKRRPAVHPSVAYLFPAPVPVPPGTVSTPSFAYTPVGSMSSVAASPAPGITAPALTSVPAAPASTLSVAPPVSVPTPASTAPQSQAAAAPPLTASITSAAPAAAKASIAQFVASLKPRKGPPASAVLRHPMEVPASQATLAQLPIPQIPRGNTNVTSFHKLRYRGVFQKPGVRVTVEVMGDNGVYLCVMQAIVGHLPPSQLWYAGYEEL